MRGLMMDYPLSIPAIVRRADALFSKRMVVSRLPDGSIDRRPYANVLDRARRLAVALKALGIRPGDRVASLAWASHQHLEAYLGVPSMGAVLHTLNLRLHHEELSYIINDAEDRVILLDECVLPLFERIRPHVRPEHVVVLSSGGSGGDVPEAIDYEQLLDSAAADAFVEPDIQESDAAAMSYTSGTTGRPKGVLYSHRSLFLHSLALGLRDSIGIGCDDTTLPIVPMFHVNAWGMPYASTLFGAGQVLPGPLLDPGSILGLLVDEKVTLAAGVPTVWLGVLNELDKNPGAADLRCLRSILIGGSAAPESMIRAYQERHGLRIVHAWGMTEMSPVDTICNLPSTLGEATAEEQYRYRAAQGTPLPLVEIRARTDDALAPWDGVTMGELEVRGPWVANRYYGATESDGRFTDDGWFKTGDIVTIDEQGCITITDRTKDLVKSGGEWISSVALETALMGHPAVAEAAVVAIPHPRWDERPLAVVVPKPGQTIAPEELIAFLAARFAKWWLPDAIEFATEIPRTSVGKFKKSVLRDRYRDRYQPAGAEPV